MIAVLLAAIAFVRADGIATGCPASGTTCAHTLAVASSAGDDLIVGVSYDTSCTLTSVTDSTSGVNTYAQKAHILNSTAGQNQDVWVGHQTNSATSVTINWTGSCSSSFTGATYDEYSGVLAYGNNGTATGNSATVSTSVTLQAANNFVAAGFWVSGSSTFTATAGTIRKQVANATNGSVAGIDNTSASTGSLAVTATVTSAQWAAAAVELCLANPCVSAGGGPAESGMRGFWGLDMKSTLPYKFASRRISMEVIDDLLGPAAPPAKPRKVNDLLGKRKYTPLKAPKKPQEGGIFALREQKGQNLGRTCLICKDVLKPRRGRPPVICRKQACFRAYRNAYRLDYDAVRA